MAGGMSRRGADRESIADRIATTQARKHAAKPPATHVAGYPPPPPKLKHCWVTNHLGRHAGLLLGWRNVDGAWEGRVAHPILADDGWTLYEEWLPSAMLEQARTT